MSFHRVRLFTPVDCEDFVTESGRVLSRRCYNKTSYSYDGNALCTPHAKAAKLWPNNGEVNGDGTKSQAR